MSIHRLVLVLNASYEPIHICTARRAITMVLKGAAVVEECSAYTIRTSRIDVPVPSVIRLRQYRRMPRVQRAVSRRGILLRDAGACQYCGRRLELGESGGLLHAVQQPKGQSHAAGSRHGAPAPAAPDQLPREPSPDRGRQSHVGQVFVLLNCIGLI
jgi:hypothetical protein